MSCQNPAPTIKNEYTTETEKATKTKNIEKEANTAFPFVLPHPLPRNKCNPV